MSNNLLIKKPTQSIHFFYQPFLWNIIEAGAFQTILLLHQYFLYKTIMPESYGLTGVLLSFVYGTIYLCNTGLDGSIYRFFTEIKTKQKFYSIFALPFATQLLLLSIIAPAACLYFNLDNYLYILPALMCVEFTKKTLRTILHCLLKNKYTTTLELLGIMLYVSIIWTYYSYTKLLSPFFLLATLLFISSLQLPILIFLIFKWYQTLPLINNKRTLTTSFYHIAYYRSIFSLYKIFPFIFSANFLIPFIGWHYSLIHAASLKYVSHIYYFIYILLYKAFGNSIHTYLALTKQSFSSSKKAFFLKINTFLFFILSLLFLAAFLAIGYNFYYQTSMIKLYFFILLLTESFLINYERLCFIKDVLLYPIYIHMAVVIILAIILYSSTIQSLESILLLCIALRILSVAIIIRYANYSTNE